MKTQHTQHTQNSYKILEEMIDEVSKTTKAQQKRINRQLYAVCTLLVTTLAVVYLVYAVSTL
jgi:DNA transposition AAA+ family ATPase